MDEYITKEQAINALLLKGQKSTRYKLGDTWELNLFEIQEAINAMPAADVQPIRRGRWIYKGTVNGWDEVACSCCDEAFAAQDREQIFDWDYCPHCGFDNRNVPDTEDMKEIANMVEFKRRMKRD